MDGRKAAMAESFIYVVIPALDEEASLPRVLADLVPILETSGRRFEVIVVDNGSRDATPEVAVRGGATLLREAERGYGAACLQALAYIDQSRAQRDGDDAIVVFLDADYSDDPRDIEPLLAPILDGEADLVLGSRLVEAASRAAVPLPSRVGNRIASGVIHALYGVRFSDLGPFRAIRHEALTGLAMRDRSWGWTVEMQIRACRNALRIREIPVRYRARFGGESKISGSLWGGVKAGAKILWVLQGALFTSLLEGRRNTAWGRS